MEAVYIEVEKTLLCMSAHPFEPCAYLFLCTERESQKGDKVSVQLLVATRSLMGDDCCEEETQDVSGL